MRHVLALLLQTGALLAGLVALYLAAFVYEKGRARFHNSLEDRWVGLRQDPRFSKAPASAFLQSFCGLLEVESTRRIGTFPSSDWIISSVHFSFVSCLWLWLISLGGWRWLKLFRKHVGVAPKTLAGLYRFHKFYRKWVQTTSFETIKDELYELYYDQSHFSKESRRVTGFPPTEFRASISNEFDRRLLQE